MSQTSSRLLRALRDLALAMINATLILIVLCLFLGLRLSNRVETIATNVTGSLVSVEPLRAGVEEMTGEISGLRGDLSRLRDAPEKIAPQQVQALSARLAALEERMNGVGGTLEQMRARVDAAGSDPHALVNHAIETTANRFVAGVGLLAGCEIPAAQTPQQMPPPATAADGN